MRKYIVWLEISSKEKLVKVDSGRVFSFPVQFASKPRLLLKLLICWAVSFDQNPPRFCLNKHIQAASDPEYLVFNE